MLKEAMRPVWVEIDLKNIEYNVKQIQAKVGGAEIIGVVKADAYGHGSLEVSKVLLENGVKRLAVGTIQEAITLRENGITTPIIMLGLTPPLYHDILVEYEITPVTGSYENAKSLSDAAKAAGVVMEGLLTVDTGMGRIGFLPTDESIDEIAKIYELENFKVQGIFSHFASADDKDKSYTNLQIERYQDFFEKLEKRNLNHTTRSFANSAAIMEFPDAYFDAVRPGVILYGCYPSPDMDRSHLSLKPVMSVKANIIHLKKSGPRLFSQLWKEIYYPARELDCHLGFRLCRWLSVAAFWERASYCKWSIRPCGG
jgi:alanine racemase